MRRIFCIGRNYGEHAKELGNSIPKEPIIFMKPESSLVFNQCSFCIPKSGYVLHHEVEVVIELSGRTSGNLSDKISGVTLGVDLTLRDLQLKLMNEGLPWERAKSFDESALLGELKPLTEKINLANLVFDLKINGELRQQGNTKDMLNNIETLIESVAAGWNLMPGDLIYTGTPKGVSSLKPGDRLVASSPVLGEFFWDLKK